MRPLHLADVEIAARVLALVDPDDRVRVMQNMITKAEMADAYRQLHGRPHPQFGTGTLMSSATRWAAAPRPAALDPDALHALNVVTRTLWTHLIHQFA
jgi:hypothetical protein